MKIRFQNILFAVTGILITISSCEFGAKEEFLGNNLYLSEYDCVDRRILYKSKRQSVSGIEIVPMTVSELAYNNNWIIAKTKELKNNKLIYWVILNQYDKSPSPEEIKENTFGPLNKVDFDKYVFDKKIGLTLKQIEC